MLADGLSTVDSHLSKKQIECMRLPMPISLEEAKRMERSSQSLHPLCYIPILPFALPQMSRRQGLFCDDKCLIYKKAFLRAAKWHCGERPRKGKTVLFVFIAVRGEHQQHARLRGKLILRQRLLYAGIDDGG